MPNPVKVIKGISKGAAKVKKRVQNLQEEADYRTGGDVSLIYKKGILKDLSGGTGSGKVKPRNMGKVTKQIAPNSKKQTKSINKIIKKHGKAIIPNGTVNPRSVPKVTVKKRGN